MKGGRARAVGREGGAEGRREGVASKRYMTEEGREGGNSDHERRG